MAFRYSPALSSKSIPISDYSRAQVSHPFSYDSSTREPPLTPALGSIGSLRSPKTSKDKQPEKFDIDVHNFITNLRRSKHYGSSAVAKDTCILLRTVIIKGKFLTVEDLIDTIRDIGKELIQARPLELVIGNIVRRVLYIIRREFAVIQKQERYEMKRLQTIQSMQSLNDFNSNNSNNSNNNDIASSDGIICKQQQPKSPNFSILDDNNANLTENQRKLMAIRGNHSQIQVLNSNIHTKQTNISGKSGKSGKNVNNSVRRHSSLRNLPKSPKNNNNNNNTNTTNTVNTTVVTQSAPQTETGSPKEKEKNRTKTKTNILSHSGFDIQSTQTQQPPHSPKSPKTSKNTNKNTNKNTQNTNNTNNNKTAQNGIFTINNNNNNTQPFKMDEINLETPFNTSFNASNASISTNNSSNSSSSSSSSSSSDLSSDAILSNNNNNLTHNTNNIIISAESNSGMNPSLLDMFHAKDEIDYSVSFKSKFKSIFINEINALKDEILNVYDGIEEYSVEHIHSNESILTYGSSRTVLHFLKYASKYRAFEVFIAESAPSLTGQKMAYDLTKECKYDSKNERGIRSVTIISDSAIFAIMSRVNKVIIGTHCVLANGGLLTHCGTHQLALAAKYHRVPVVVVTGLYKLSPLYAFDQDTFNEQGPSQSIMRYEEQCGRFEDILSIVNPIFDFVPPELVDLLITNNGGYSPSYIYWLLAEYYSTWDYDL